MATKFEEWCAEKGYDPKGEFEVIDEDARIGTGRIVRLKRDDDSENPWFTDGGFDGIAISFESRLTQHKPIQFDPHTFDFRQVLPKCWVRDYLACVWREAHFIKKSDCMNYPYSAMWRVAGDSVAFVFGTFTYCTFEDPAIEQRKSELKARADELRAELAKIEAELGE